MFRNYFFWVLLSLSTLPLYSEELPLYYWHEKWHGRSFVNFGDYLSLKVVERMVGSPVRVYKKIWNHPEKKLLAIGSIFSFARDGDVVWGSGMKRWLPKTEYRFTHLDVRCVRGPLTRAYLQEHFHIDCPEIYGDPALLFPYLYPEFKRKENPTYDYIIIPHFSEEDLFLKEEWENVVYSTEPWEEVLTKILDSRFIITSSLHGIIVAEAYGIPARLLRVTENEPLFKYQDYYFGTGRPLFRYATSVEEALEMGGEPPFECDIEKVFEAFPFDHFPQANPLICWEN